MTHNHMINKDSELGQITDVSSHMPNEASTGYKSHSNLGSRIRKRKIPLQDYQTMHKPIFGQNTIETMIHMPNSPTKMSNK